jgi:CRISPR-associated protein (TIGR02710 family)
MKALVISIGTGTRPGHEAVESLASGITYSIQNSNPDKVFFVVSKESINSTFPSVLKNIGKPYETIQIDDPDDINKIYESLSGKFMDIRRSFDHVTVDFTSGTKAMTGALTVLGSLYEVDTLSYVTGKRSGGIVVKGTEQVLTLRPYPIIIQRKLSEATSFFNRCQFDSCLAIIEELSTRIPDPQLLSQVLPLRNAALAYSAWDRFDHEGAFRYLRELKVAGFEGNKEFLGKLVHASKREPYLIADLISNAKRRGEIENKYDDAVARLYRTAELIAQYKLSKYGIRDTGIVPKDKVPGHLHAEFSFVDEKARIGLYQAYQLLAAYGDDLGQRFLQDRKLQDLLQKRNTSILAHGLVSVTKAVYEVLLDIVLSYAANAVANLHELLPISTFPRWPA